MTSLGICRYHYVLSCILFVRLDRDIDPLAELNYRLGVSDSRAHLDEHGCIELLGNVISFDYEVLSFLGISGLEHRHLGRDGIMS